MIARILKSWRDAGDQLDRQIAAALTLPLEDFFRATGTLIGGLGAILGLCLGGVPGSMAGGLIGWVAGAAANFVILCLIHLIPAPFAWLARCLGYA
jgi:hypothetical protein